MALDASASTYGRKIGSTSVVLFDGLLQPLRVLQDLSQEMVTGQPEATTSNDRAVMISKGLEVGLQKRLTVETKVGVGFTSRSLGDEIVICLYSTFETSTVLVGATLVDISF